MTPDYDFERFDPPALSEKKLRQELDRREARRNTVLLAVAGALFEVLFILVGLLLWEFYPVLTLGCICFAVVSIAGSGVIAIVFTQKGDLNCGCTL